MLPQRLIPTRAWPAVLLALGLCAPSLFMGFLADDWLHLAILDGLIDAELSTSRLDLYRFTDGDPEHLRQAVERGPYPWWTDQRLLVAFFRPLSSLLANLDHALFGLWAPGYHLHSLAWLAGLMLAWWAVLRRSLSPVAAGLALLLAALDDTHAIAVAWVANRNAVVATTLAMAGFAAHLSWRERGARWGLPLSLVGLSLGLLGGETALGVCGFWGAYELFGARGRLGARLLRLAPATGLGVAYLFVHKAANCGARHSAIYVDPWFQPLSWLLAAPGRALAMVGNLVLNAPVDLWLVPAARPALVAAGLLGMGLLALIAWVAWDELESEERRALAWLAPGTLLALAPFTSTFPSSRLLVAPGLGATAVVALLLVALGRSARGWLAKGSGGLLLLVHGVLSPLTLVGTVAGLSLLATVHRSSALEAPEAYGAVEGQRLVVLGAADPFAAFYPTLIRGLHGHPLPYATWVVSLYMGDQRLTRVADDAFELEAIGGRYMDGVFEQLFRDMGQRPFQRGDRFQLAGAEVEVVEVLDGHPTRFRLSADVSLGDPSLLFVHYEGYRMLHTQLPAVGESLLIPWTPPFGAP